MNFIIGNSIPVATNFVRSNPAIPIYRGEEKIENLYAVLYHIEIGYNKDGVQEECQYVIVDYKEYSLEKKDRESILEIANQYCEKKGIINNPNLEIILLDDEVAENFIERIFNNMKIVRGLISK